jgi:3-oxoacyl-(acyl-carrier-protein) synthase
MAASMNQTAKSFERATERDPIVVTGVGMVAAGGLGVSANFDVLTSEEKRTTLKHYDVVGFNPAPHLSDRKVIKSVSPRDVLGLVAFEDCVKASGLDKNSIDHERTGLYVGAPPSATPDNHNYSEGVEATRDGSGHVDERKFGATYRSANPTTLLQGLPNNVLCYGSKTLDARGPNSNYTSMEVSAHLAVVGALRAIRLGRIDCAIVGGYSAHLDKVYLESQRRRPGRIKVEAVHAENYAITPYSANDPGTIPASGACFMTIERASHAAKRGAKPFATVLSAQVASDASWPHLRLKSKHNALEHLLSKTLRDAGLTPSVISVISLAATGIKELDEIEKNTVKSIFNAEGSSIPMLVGLSQRWGNLMEAGGIADVATLKRFIDEGVVCKNVRIETDFGDIVQRGLPTEGPVYVMVLRAAVTGEYSCMLLAMKAGVD